MRAIFQITVLLIFTSVAALAQEKPVPRFEDYPAKERFAGKAAPVKLSGPQARMMRTVLKSQSKAKPDFAGHYNIAAWGCGSMGATCFAIIDARTGNVYFPPNVSLVTLGSLEQTEDTMDWRKNSRLIIFTGVMEVDDTYGNGKFYCVWKNNRLQLIRFIGKRIDSTNPPSNNSFNRTRN